MAYYSAFLVKWFLIRFLDHEIKFSLNLYNLTLKDKFSLCFNNSNHFEPSLVDIGQVVREKEVKNALKVDEREDRQNDAGPKQMIIKAIKDLLTIFVILRQNCH